MPDEEEETPAPRRRGRPPRIVAEQPAEEDTEPSTEQAAPADERPWGWWTVFESIEEYRSELARTVAPDPITTRIIDINRQYSPEELRAGLQACTSYLATLFAIEGLLEGQSGALTKALKTGLSISAVNLITGETSVSGREAAALASSDILRNTRKLEIDTDSRLSVVTGFRKAYETAQFGFSRLISLHIGESDLQTDRHP